LSNAGLYTHTSKTHSQDLLEVEGVELAAGINKEKKARGEKKETLTKQLDFQKKEQAARHACACSSASWVSRIMAVIQSAPVVYPQHRGE
jgi:hypothetical protein